MAVCRDRTGQFRGLMSGFGAISPLTLGSAKVGFRPEADLWAQIGEAPCFRAPQSSSAHHRLSLLHDGVGDHGLGEPLHRLCGHWREHKTRVKLGAHRLGNKDVHLMNA
jgi:hypothetical protein